MEGFVAYLGGCGFALLVTVLVFGIVAVLLSLVFVCFLSCVIYRFYLFLLLSILVLC